MLLSKIHPFQHNEKKPTPQTENSIGDHMIVNILWSWYESWKYQGVKEFHMMARIGSL